MTGKRVNLYLNAAAVANAKKVGYNISALARNAIKEEIKKKEQENTKL